MSRHSPCGDKVNVVPLLNGVDIVEGVEIAGANEREPWERYKTVSNLVF